MSDTLNDISIDELYKLIGRNVSKLRKVNNLSQLDLSLAMGNKSVSLISSSELYTNKKHFNIQHLHKISKILNVSITEFFKPVSEVTDLSQEKVNK